MKSGTKRAALSVGVVLSLLFLVLSFHKLSEGGAKLEEENAGPSGERIGNKPLLRADRVPLAAVPAPIITAENDSSRSASNPPWSLANELRTSPNLREFIRGAMARPAEGGRFFATLAYLQCNKLAGVDSSAGDSISDVQKEARNQLRALQQRCEGVAAQHGTLIEFLKMIQHQGDANDPLMRNGGSVAFGIRTSSSASAVMADVLARGQGDLSAVALETQIEKLLEEGAIKPTGEQTDPTLWFRAAAAVGCELAGTCVGSELTTIPCALQNSCYADYRDGVLATVPKEKQSEYLRNVRQIRAFVGLK